MFPLKATPFILIKYIHSCDLVIYKIIWYVQVLLLTLLLSICVRIKRLMLVNIPFYYLSRCHTHNRVSFLFHSLSHTGLTPKGTLFL